MTHDDRRRRFELLALPHLDAAYNLARHLAGNGVDAEDVVQEAYLRAYRYFDRFRGEDFRVWLLAIVRNCFFSWLRDNRGATLHFTADPAPELAADAEPLWGHRGRDPEAEMIAQGEQRDVGALLAGLAHDQREALLLREVEELAYADIARITGVPIGTVMSRLARARARLRALWAEAANRMPSPPQGRATTENRG